MKKLYSLPLLLTIVAQFFFTKINALDFYWVNNGGNWSDASNHWATTSGGSVFHAIVPGPSDHVYFDANSFTIPGQTVTIDQTIIQCNNMTWTGVTNNPTFSGINTNILRVYGSLTLSAAMTYSFTGGVFFEATTTGKTITLAGKTLGQTTFAGLGGGWTFLDPFATINTINFNNGTLDFNNQPVLASFVSTTTSARTLHMRSSTITGFWNMNSSGMTLNAGTSTINIPNAGSSAQLGSGLTYYNVSFPGTVGNTINGIGNIVNNVTANAELFMLGNNTYNNVTLNNNGTITGSNTFNTLTFAAGRTYTFPSGMTQVVSGITANGNCSNYITIRSSNAGSQATIQKSSGSVVISYASLQDINATGGASFTANTSLNLGNNTGWTINSPAIQTLYWVGGSGNWSDGNHWAASSGGSASGCAPTAIDHVVFDANSFSAPGQTVTIDQTNIYCNNMTWTGVTNNPTFSGINTNNLRIYGSLTLSAAMTYSFPGTVFFEATTTGKTITLAGKAIYRATFSGFGGGWTFLDPFTTTQSLNFNAGNLNFNNQPVMANAFTSNTTSARTLSMGSSTITGSWEMNSAGMTLNAGTSTIIVPFTFSSAQLSSGLTYYNISFTSVVGNTINGMGNTINNVTATGELFMLGNNTYNNVTFGNNGTITGSNTFNSLSFAAGRIYTFPSGLTQLVNGINATGNCNNLISIRSSTTGSQATIQKSSGSIVISYVSIRDMNATGGATFTANSSTNLGNNTGWNINGPTTQTLYWIGGSGNWSDGNHWATGSGGSASGCAPSAIDHVVFDANSFTAPGQAVTIDQVNSSCNNMNWTSVTNNPTLTGTNTNNLRVHGSLTLSAAMNYTFAGNVFFEATTSGKNITLAGKTRGPTTFNGIGGGWIFLDPFAAAPSLNFNNGNLNFNDQPVSASFVSSTSSARTLSMGSSIYTGSWTMNSPGMTLNAGTSTIVVPGVLTSAQLGSGHTYHNISFPGNVGNTINGMGNIINNVSATGELYMLGNNTYNNVVFNSNGLVMGNNTFNSITLAPGFTYTFTAGTTQTITPAGQLIAIGNGSFPIRIQSGTTGSPVNFIKTAGSVCLDYVRISDNHASGGAVFNAGLSPTRSLDMGGNSGWLFTGGCSTLPLNILEFTARKGANSTVELRWKTTDEVNMAHYIVERSSDAATFTPIGQQPATSSMSVHNYALIDNQPLVGTNFYRLKMVEQDNSFTYSRLVAIKPDATTDLIVFPNPAKDILYLQINGAASETVTVRLIDTWGNMIRQEKRQINGASSFSIDIRSIPIGVYYIRIEGNKINSSQKIVKGL